MGSLNMYLLNIADRMVYLWGTLLMLLPSRKWFRWESRKTYFITCSFTFLFCMIWGAFETLAGSRIPEYPVMLVCFLVCRFAIEMPPLKLLYLFLSSTAYLSFGGLVGVLCQAYFWPESEYTWGLLIQHMISLLACLSVWRLKERMGWLFEYNETTWMWRTIWTVPAVIILMNVYSKPLYYETIRVGRVFIVGLVIEVVCAFFFMMWQIMLYVYSQSAWKEYSSRNENQLYQSEIEYYRMQIEHMEEVRRLRHDIRHILLASGELLKENKYEELADYLKEYTEASYSDRKPRIYSKNNVVNAILTSYEQMAEENSIRTAWTADLGEATGVSDVDISVLLGNLIENAIHGCLTVPEEKRYIKMLIDAHGLQELYITMENSFDGNIRSRKGGIGQKSVNLIVGKYNGTYRFWKEDGRYNVNIMMKVNI